MAVSYGTYTITEVQEGSQIWTSSAAPTTPNYTFDVSKLVGDSETSIKSGDIIMHSYNRYTVLSISSDGKTVLAGNLQSIRGATGAASVTYALIVSNLAIVKDKDGNLSPSTITVTAKSQTGSNAMANYTGRIKIETTTNNSTWTSRINEDAATKTYTIPSDTVAIRCSLYLKGGTTTLLDQQTVPVVSDGIDGTNITITSTSVTYQKGTSGTVKPTGTWETDVQSVSVGQGEYLWTRTIVNYSDGSSTEAYSVSRNAVNGTNGTNGKDGKDGTSPTVSSTVTEYAQSTNGSTPPTSGWDTTPKTATAGQYMWTRVTVTYSDSATAVSYTVSKNGTNGTNGINTATVYLYKKGTTAPSVPSGNTTYTFSTKKLTGTLDSWTQEIPTTGSGQCYVTAAVASSNGTTDTIGTGEWSTPIQFNGTNGTNGINGTNGTNGLNQATIFLYKRGTSVTKPTTSVTYTFSTGKLSAEPNGWTRNIPTINGSPCWVVSATAIGSETTATIAGSNWSDPIKLVEDGVDGKDAYSIVLTNENHTFAGNTTSAIANEIECNVIAYKGATQIAATIGTITGQPTGMTTEILNNGKTNASFKVKVTTSMVTKNGVLNIPITVDGKVFTKKFTYTLALKGSAGTSENLLMDVYASSLTKVDAPWDRYLSDASNSTITGQFIAEANLPDPNATHFYRITDSSASTHGRALCFYSSGTPPFITGHTYRIGCWVRKHAGSPKMHITLGSIGAWMPTQRIIDNTDWEWIEVVRTFGETDASKTAQSDTYKRLYFYFYNNNVAGSSLDMCGFKMEEVQVNSGTARNLLLGTEKLTNWGTVNGATISNGVATFPTITANSWREIYPAKNFKYELIRNQYTIFSIKVKGNVDEKCCINLCVGVDTTETAYTRQKYFNQMIFFIGTGEWQTVCSAVPIFDYIFTGGSGTVDFNNCWVTVRIGAVNTYWNGFQVKEPQLCLGTTATSWSRAPEDFDEIIDNIEVGGRNLVRNTALMPTIKINGYNFRASGNGSTVTHIDLNDSPINGITGAIRVINSSSSSSKVGMCQDSLKNCFIAGEAYTMSCWVKASTDIDVVFETIWASTSQTTGSSVTTLGTKFKVGTDWTYLKWEGATLLGAQVSQYSAGYVYGTNVPANGWLEICGLKVEKGNKATAWTPAPEDIQDGIDYAQNVANVALSQSVEYIIGTQTAVTGSWTGISNTISELKDGTQIRYWLPHAGSGNATLNLTLTNGTTTGAIPIYRQGGYVSNGNIVANRVTTHFPTGSVVSMTYGVDRSISVVSSGTTYTGLFTGWFADGAYDSGNTVNRVRLQNVITAETAITAGHIICGTANGYKNIGANISFDLSYPLLYASSAITASKTGDNNYLSINGVSATSNGTVQSGAAKKTLYLKGKVTGNTFKISASPFMTTVQPTTDDGYYYIPLGIMYSTTAIYFQSSNRLYAYIDGAFQPVDTAAVLRAEEAKKVATNYLSADSTGIMIADMNDGEQKPSEATGNNVFINNTSVNIRDGQTTLASFGVDGMQIGLSNESHTNQDYHSWQMIDKEGNSYVHISDLRDTTGWAIFEESYVPIVNFDMGPEPCEYAIELAFPINYNSDIISAEINGVAVNSWEMLGSVKPSEYIKLTPLPNKNDNVTIKYKSSDSALKAYTFGTRQDSSVLGGFSFAEGYNTVARGRCSHVEGYQCKAIGYYSHAEGSGSTANGRGAHAESSGDAYGDYSHAESLASAYGHYSHAEGSGGAYGQYSHSQNQSTLAYGDAQTSIGRWNIADDNNTYALIIGNGTDSSHRSNALTVKWDGTITAGNGFSTANTALTISRVISTTYMNDAAFNRIKAYKKNGMLYLCFNAEFTSAYSVSNYTTIATISNWKAVFDAYATIPRQNDGSKIVMLLVTSDGKIQVYSTTSISGWHRASICIPCSS